MSDMITFRRGAQRFQAEGREWVPAEDYDRLYDVLYCARQALSKPIATVINNNQPGWTNIIETAPNVTLPVGTKLYDEAALFAVGCGVADEIWQRESSPEG